MKILVACEESQAVTIAFRNKGHEAYSCDLQECSGGHPEWHIQDDVLKVIHMGGYDMMIAFPPCTHLAVSGAAWFSEKIKDGRQQEAIDFFMKIVLAPINKICVENPVGIMSKKYKKPTQIIHPYYFGDEAQKATCLWLKNLPPLFHASQADLFNNEITHVGKGEMMKCIRKDGKIELRARHNQGLSPGPERAKIRSKTFPGIAQAMADQWG